MARRKPPRRERGKAPESEYRDAEGNVLVLRGAMTPGTRRQYADTAGANPLGATSVSRDDAWQRSVEFLFERLVVRWEIAGTEPLTRQHDLLARFRFATSDERSWIRGVLREHLAEHFPDLEAP